MFHKTNINNSVSFIPETDITKTTEEILKYTLRTFTPGRSMLDATKELMQRIYHDFKFKPGFTAVATPLAEIMKERVFARILLT